MSKLITNQEQFNVKYSEYLESGHYGCALSDLSMLEYLDKEFKELVKIPGFKYTQIKSKFNWYCFYCTNVPQNKVEEITNKLKYLEANETL